MTSYRSLQHINPPCLEDSSSTFQSRSSNTNEEQLRLGSTRLSSFVDKDSLSFCSCLRWRPRSPSVQSSASMLISRCWYAIEQPTGKNLLVFVTSKLLLLLGRRLALHHIIELWVDLNLYDKSVRSNHFCMSGFASLCQLFWS